VERIGIVEPIRLDTGLACAHRGCAGWKQALQPLRILAPLSGIALQFVPCSLCKIRRPWFRCEHSREFVSRPVVLEPANGIEGAP
jgi:hypothetical protein